MTTSSRTLDADQSGANYNVDANNALAALDTCHSGTSEPTTDLYHGKLWLDTNTSPGILKIYNNAAWEPVGGQNLRTTDSPQFESLKIATGATQRLNVAENGTIAVSTDKGSSGQVLTSNGPVSPVTWEDPPSAFPIDGIILWAGTTPPSGWYICNGANGTPNLANRFVVGYGSSYPIGATGGASTVTLSASQIPSHRHTFSGTTNTTGAHSHTYSRTSKYYGSTRSPFNDPAAGFETKSTSSAGAHNHTVSGNTGYAGSGGSHENRPPYYSLAYIQYKG
jgi:microcystin-dependent protein